MLSEFTNLSFWEIYETRFRELGIPSFPQVYKSKFWDFTEQVFDKSINQDFDSLTNIFYRNLQIHIVRIYQIKCLINLDFSKNGFGAFSKYGCIYVCKTWFLYFSKTGSVYFSKNWFGRFSKSGFVHLCKTWFLDFSKTGFIDFSKTWFGRFSKSGFVDLCQTWFSDFSKTGFVDFLKTWFGRFSKYGFVDLCKTGFLKFSKSGFVQIQISRFSKSSFA